MTLRALLAPIAVVVLLGPAAEARAAPAAVDIPGRFFAPARVSIIAGESVTWTNRDFFDHDVAAVDRVAFDSGRMGPGASFSRAFASAGTYPYLCTIHPLMRGEVEVFAFGLRGPAAPVPVGARTFLRGLVPSGIPAVTIERRGPDGSFHAVATAPVSSTGAFRAAVVPTGPTVYRAVAGALSSAPFALPVSARLRLTVRRLRGGRVALRATARPAQARAPVALELYSRERFDWRQVAHTRLDARSTVTFRFHARRRVRARVLLARGTGGYAPAVSGARTIGPRRGR